MPGSLVLNPQVQLDSNRGAVHAAATVTASGSAILNIGLGTKEISLFINVVGPVSGLAPSLTYSIAEVDPGDETTVIGATTTGAALTALGVQIITLRTTRSPVVKVSWVVTGTVPSFANTYATIVTKATTTATGIDSSGNERPISVDLNGQINVVNTLVPYGALSDFAVGGVTNGGGSAGNLIAMRMTAYNEQSANFTGSIVSSSANDAATGTGARTVEITYYDSAGAGPFLETVTLNGTTSVPLVSSTKCFIEKMRVLTVGSLAANAGSITLRNDAVATVGILGFGNMLTSPAKGDGRTYWAHHYVATGKLATFAAIVGGTTGNQNAQMHLRTVPIPVANKYEVQISESITIGVNAASTVRILSRPLQVMGPARVVMYHVPTGNSSTFFGSFDFSEN